MAKPKDPPKKEIELKLEAHRDFLRKACAAFDDGYADEAVRMAVAIRSLFEDAESPGLLKFLGIRDKILYCSTAGRYLPSKMIPYLGFLTFKQHDGGGMEFLAACQSDKETPIKWMKYEDYWNEIVFDDTPVYRSRRQLIVELTGHTGEHEFEEKITSEYEALLERQDDLGWRYPFEQAPSPFGVGIIYADTRQIAHEVLESLDAYFSNIRFTRKATEKSYFTAILGEARYFYELRGEQTGLQKVIDKDKRVTEIQERRGYEEKAGSKSGDSDTRLVIIP